MTQDTSIANIPLIARANLSDLDIIQNIRADISEHVKTVLTPNDKAAHVLIAIVNGSGFVDCLVENKAGEYRHEGITPTCLQSIYDLKVRQATPEKGAWLAVQFQTEADGFITSTTYNYDRLMYTGDTPEAWYTRPEQDTGVGFLALEMEPGDLVYESLFTTNDYAVELADFPRSNDSAITDKPTLSDQ